MALRFHKSVKLFGVRLNFSKSGVSASVGSAPLTLNTSKEGLRVTASAPGTGFSWSQLFRRK